MKRKPDRPAPRKSPPLRAHFVLSPWAARIASFIALIIMAGCGGSVYKPPKGVSPVERRLEATAYCNCGKCCNWKRNWYGRPVIASGPNKGKPKHVGLTASGTKTRHGTIAADTRRYPFGTILYVPGYGYGRVEDRGSSIVGDKIDLWFPSHSEALEWGRRKVTVRVWFPPQ